MTKANEQEERVRERKQDKQRAIQVCREIRDSKTATAKEKLEAIRQLEALHEDIFDYDPLF